MGCAGDCCKKIVVAICSIIKCGIAIAIIIIVALKLQDITVTTYDNWDAKCLMSGDVYGQSLCSYAYAVCGISLLASLVLSIFLCVTCDCCGCGDWLTLIVSGAQLAWWIIAAIVFTTEGKNANNQDVPNEEWRVAVIVLAWCAVGFIGVQTLALLIGAVNTICKCLCCCCPDRRESGSKANTA